jgi:hypothetical protein
MKVRRPAERYSKAFNYRAVPEYAPNHRRQSLVFWHLILVRYVFIKYWDDPLMMSQAAGAIRSWLCFQKVKPLHGLDGSLGLQILNRITERLISVHCTNGIHVYRQFRTSANVGWEEYLMAPTPLQLFDWKKDGLRHLQNFQKTHAEQLFPVFNSNGWHESLVCTNLS